MAKTPQFPMTTVVGKKEEALERGAYDHPPCFSSSFTSRKKEDEKQYRKMLPRKERAES